MPGVRLLLCCGACGRALRGLGVSVGWLGVVWAVGVLGYVGGVGFRLRF